MTSALVLRTAGTNCDRETVLALERAGAKAERVHLHRLVDEPARLDQCEILVLPGGFSYGDDVAAGRVLGQELRHFLGEALRSFVERHLLVRGLGGRVVIELATDALRAAHHGGFRG